MEKMAKVLLVFFALLFLFILGFGVVSASYYHYVDDERYDRSSRRYNYCDERPFLTYRADILPRVSLDKGYRVSVFDRQVIYLNNRYDGGRSYYVNYQYDFYPMQVHPSQGMMIYVNDYDNRGMMFTDRYGMMSAYGNGLVYLN